jgi:hypothetical protein
MKCKIQYSLTILDDSEFRDNAFFVNERKRERNPNKAHMEGSYAYIRLDDQRV